MSTVLDLSNFTFPILYFSQGLANVAYRPAELTSCTRAALRGGFYRRMLIVEASGRSYRVAEAREVPQRGPVRRLLAALGQVILVELVSDGPPFQSGVDDVRSKVQRSFRRWGGWSTRDDFEELKQRVADAQSVAEILGILSWREG